MLSNRYRCGIAIAVESPSLSNCYRYRIAIVIKSLSLSNRDRYRVTIAIESLSLSNRYRYQIAIAIETLLLPNRYCCLPLSNQKHALLARSGSSNISNSNDSDKAAMIRFVPRREAVAREGRPSAQVRIYNLGCSPWNERCSRGSSYNAVLNHVRDGSFHVTEAGTVPVTTRVTTPKSYLHLSHC